MTTTHGGPAADRPYRLSHEQESLWFREVFTDRLGMSNVPAAWRIRGALDAGALRGACAEVMRRHPALRTVFDTADSVPRQWADPAAVPDFAVVDRATEEAVRQAGRAELLHRFDLRGGPPVRFRLYRLGAGHHVFVMTAHHLVIDAASVGIALTEIGEFYRAAVTGTAARLAPLTLEHRDFVALQRADVDDARLAELTAYWTRRLAGAPQTVGLATDRPRPRNRRALGGVALDRVPAGLDAGLRELARQTGATEFIVLLAAFRLLLWRSSGQRDLLIGAPVSGRDHAGSEDLVGFFINMLVLRGTVGGRMSFRDLVAAERDSVLGAFDHKDMPFSRLVEAMRPDRDPASSPLVQVTFSYRPADAGAPALPGLEVGDFHLHGTSLQFDLVLELLRDGDGAEVLCGYDEDIFDPETIRALVARFPVLLAAALAEPDRPAADLCWTTPADREAMSRSGRGPAERGGPLPADAVAAWARRRPGAVAVRHAGVATTYAGLDAAADRLAARLLHAGLGPESPVGVLLDDRGELPVTVLAVARAGCALLPLDPAHPARRHTGMLRDAGARALITDRQAGDLPPEAADLLLPPAGPARIPALPAVDPDQLAYLLYTSGSTGRPKAVGVSHRSLANCLDDTRDELGVAPGTRMASASPVSFDIGVLELLLPLYAGAELVVSESHRRGDGVALAEFLRASRPDFFFATPALWQMLLLAEWPGDPRLTAMTGGETVPAELASRVRGRVARLVQMYGPTETTVHSTRDTIGAGPLPALLPVGRPIAGTTAHVLDADLRPVPPGVVGELCLGGAGLARGYHGRPGLTARRFVPSPFGPPGARLYRTGDLARLLADGRLELRGRDDDQIKVNGVRVEPGEIDAVLTGHPDVEAAVTVVTGGPADASGGVRRLVACLRPAVPAYGPVAADGLVAAVRAYAGRHLPAAMTPSGYLVLDTLPITDNGKVDRARLAERAAGELARAHAPGGRPGTAGERLVADVWAAALGVPEVGPDDNFFALGGNSLLAARVMSDLRRRMGVRVPMSTLLEAPTVAAFAARLDKAAEAEGRRAEGSGSSSQGGGAGSVSWLRKGTRTPVLALAHPVGGAALCYAELVAALGGDWQVCAFESAGGPGGTLAGTAAGYLRELSDLTCGPVVFAGWSLGGLLAYEMAARTRRADGIVPSVLMIDTTPPAAFDWDAELAGDGVLRTFVREALRLTPGRSVPPPDELWHGPRREALEWLARTTGLGDVDEMARRLAVTEANLLAARAYVPRPAEVELHFVEPAEEHPRAELWMDLADTVTVAKAPGDHYSVITGAGAARIAALLADLE